MNPPIVITRRLDSSLSYTTQRPIYEAEDRVRKYLYLT